MKTKHFTPIFLLSLIIVNTQAVSTYQPNKLLELINRNALVNRLDALEVQFFKESVPTPKAPVEYQQLVEALQKQLGITTPIIVYEFDPVETQMVGMLFGFIPEARSMPGIIKINVEKFDQLSAAEMKFTLYRELFKLQHNELSASTAIGCTVWPLASFMSYRLMKAYSAWFKNHSIVTGLAAATVGLVVTGCINYVNKNKLYREADRFAAHALKCHCCLEEVIAEQESWSEFERIGRLRWGNYLPTNQLRTIAQELKNKGLVCTDHQQPHPLAQE